jgi:hypothetical protein
MHGEGTLYMGPESYTGLWQRGSKVRGQYAFPGGSLYDGFFANDEFHGMGTYKWADGRSYVGLWECGRMHGFGTYHNFSFGTTARADGFSWRGSFQSNAEQQQQSRDAFASTYASAAVHAVTSRLKTMLAEKTASAEDTTGVFLADVPAAEHEHDAPESRPPTPGPHAEVVLKPVAGFPHRNVISASCLEALVHGLDHGETKVVVAKEARSTCVESLLKYPQLQYVGQAIEIRHIERPLAAVFVNVQRAVDLVGPAGEPAFNPYCWERATWKLVHWEQDQESAPEVPVKGKKK